MSREQERLEFEEYFAARALHLRRVSYIITQDWLAAEDVTQTVFAKLFVRWSTLRRDTLDAYARRAVVNESISLARRAHREVLSAETIEQVAAPHSFDDPIPVMVRQLAPKQRAVIALRFLDDLSVAEVSEVLGISEGTVKSQSSRALRQLRQFQTRT